MRGFAEAQQFLARLRDRGATVPQPQADDAPRAAPEPRLRPLPSDAAPRGLTSQAADLAALLRASGPDALDDEALLGLLLGHVMPGRALGDLPARALARFGSFAGLLAAERRELEAFPGFGIHAVSACKLMHDAALRLARAGLLRRRLLDDPERLAAYLGMMLSRERIEQFRILFLDDADGLIADEAQARGTVNHTPVYPREVVRRAIELDASSIVLVHNHPSGDPEPSRDDLEMTAEIEDAARLFGIGVGDHVIVGNGRSLSFRERGLLRATR